MRTLTKFAISLLILSFTLVVSCKKNDAPSGESDLQPNTAVVEIDGVAYVPRRNDLHAVPFNGVRFVTVDRTGVITMKDFKTENMYRLNNVLNLNTTVRSELAFYVRTAFVAPLGQENLLPVGEGIYKLDNYMEEKGYDGYLTYTVYNEDNNDRTIYRALEDPGTLEIIKLSDKVFIATLSAQLTNLRQLTEIKNIEARFHYDLDTINEKVFD